MPDDQFFQPKSDEDQQLSRRGLIEKAGQQTTGLVGNIWAESFELMQDMINALGDKVFGRKPFIIGMGLLGLTIGAVAEVLENNPTFLKDANLARKFLPVWNEVNELRKTYTNEQLVEMLHNPFGKDGKIQLTAEEAADLLLVGDADSLYLVGGDRKNSKGVLQPGCWLQFLKDKLNGALNLFGIKGNVDFANYAQPGANSHDLVDAQQFDVNVWGNVQLGAKTLEDMKADNATDPQIPPRVRMAQHKGALGAFYGLDGDDFIPTARLVMQYLDPKSDKYDPELAAFVQDPTQDKLENSDHLADLLVSILTSYKNDKARILEYVPKALDIYKQINLERVKSGFGKMFLAFTQPFRFDEAENAPFAAANAKRGTRGRVGLSQFGEGGKMAGLLATLPFYLLLKPLLDDFEQETGIPTLSLPMIHLSGQPDIVDDTGHLIIEGHRKFGEEEAPQIFEISDERTNKILTFNKAQAVVTPIAA